MPASSRMDPLLTKAEPIRNGGNTSVIAYLRREKKVFVQAEKSRVRTCERNNCDTKISREGGAGHAPVAEAKIPLQTLVQPIVKQLWPYSPWRRPKLERVDA
ncbi:hypothetical protein DUI87_15792 [Hirundo rustica rustica]|uniref:Uncharacterized protein n=1 Tax=Hirundo rustica rustica TaxID=333673 RepID=A0A3M0K5K8_HIRRU|nr:hypothetical protein DUI87_15792 [Hirundo rustica rustica]